MCVSVCPVRDTDGTMIFYGIHKKRKRHFHWIWPFDGGPCFILRSYFNKTTFFLLFCGSFVLFHGRCQDELSLLTSPAKTTTHIHNSQHTHTHTHTNQTTTHTTKSKNHSLYSNLYCYIVLKFPKSETDITSQQKINNHFTSLTWILWRKQA